MSAGKTVGVRELKARASALLREVENTGEEVVITVRGRPVARLEPMSHSPGRSVDGMGGLRGALAHLLPSAEWEDFEDVRSWSPKPLDDA